MEPLRHAPRQDVETPGASGDDDVRAGHSLPQPELPLDLTPLEFGNVDGSDQLLSGWPYLGPPPPAPEEIEPARDGAEDLLRGRLDFNAPSWTEPATATSEDEFLVAMAFAEDTLAFDPARVDQLLAPPAPAAQPPEPEEEEPPPYPVGFGAFPVSVPPLTTPLFTAQSAPSPDVRVHRRGAGWAINRGAGVSFAGFLLGCDATRWGAPGSEPPNDTYLLHRNFRMALDITRALDLHTSRDEARAFARSARWGLLRSNADAEAFLFMAEALHDATAASTGLFDASATFTQWELDAEGRIEAQTRAAPEAGPRVSPEDTHVIDDHADDTHWNETFWEDVDRYLTELDALEVDAPALRLDTDPLDIEFHVDAPVMHFWSPVDRKGQTIEGTGNDILIIGQDDDATVILVEDGLSHAMRTGARTPLNAVVLSLSSDSWSAIDSMRWEVLATVTGVEQIRVEQNASEMRSVVIAGDFCATELNDAQVRLVRLTETGDVDFRVTRISGFSFVAEDTAPFAGAAAAMLNSPAQIPLDI